MSTTTRTRTAHAAAVGVVVAAVFASFTVVATTVAAPPTTDTPEPTRPCFIVQPRWNPAVDGPVPTCATPTWQQEGTGSRKVTTAPTMADCMNPAHRPVVQTCPYPIASGDRFARYVAAPRTP